MEAAIRTAEAEFARAGLVPEIVVEGPAEYAVTRCLLRDSGGEVVAVSAGKGAGDQSRASALFEAWEHYWQPRSWGFLRDEKARVSVLGMEELLGQDALKQEAVLHRLGSDHPTASLTCLRFDALSGGAPLQYPAFMRYKEVHADPVTRGDVSYASYLRYGSNNGSAAGMSVAEACLHALLETIERDAVSLALLDWYGKGRSSVAVVDPERLPPDLRRLHALVGEEIGCAPVLVDITTDIGVPVYIALPSQPTFPGSHGAGAALNAGYAAERALTELLQVEVNMEPMRPYEDPYARISSMRPWPRLMRIARLDPRDVLRHERSGVVQGPESWKVLYHDPRSQLAEVLRRVNASGYRAFVLRANPGDQTIPVVSVVVPGLEAFMLNLAGNPVLPTGRGAARFLRNREPQPAVVPGSGDS